MKLLKRTQIFLFEPVAPWNLGVLRFLFIATVLAWIQYRLTEYSPLPVDFWFPNGVFEFMPFLASPLESPQLIQRLYYLLGVLAAIGLFTRWTLPLFALTSIVCLGYDYNFGLGGAAKAPIVMVMMILAFSKAGDQFSVDELLLHRKKGSVINTTSWEYRWPIRSVQIFSAFAWTAAGFQKIYIGGWAWMSGQYLQMLFLTNDIGFFRAIAGSQPLCFLISWVVIVFELGSFLIFSKKFGRYFMVLETLFLILMNMVLKVHLYTWVLMILFFLDYGALKSTWVRVTEKIRR